MLGVVQINYRGGVDRSRCGLARRWVFLCCVDSDRRFGGGENSFNSASVAFSVVDD